MDYPKLGLSYTIISSPDEFHRVLSFTRAIWLILLKEIPLKQDVFSEHMKECDQQQGPYLCNICFLFFELLSKEEEVEEQGLLLSLQLQDHRIRLSHLLLFSLQSHGQGGVVHLEALQDGVGVMTH